MKGSSGPTATTVRTGNNGNNNNNTKGGGSSICRDFLRNVCTRGAKCKFYHGTDDGGKAKAGGKANGGNKAKNDKDGSSAAAPLMPSNNGSTQKRNLQDAVVFCHDFQNQATDCSRPNCRFIHCSRDVELEFRKSGYLPPHVREQVINKGIAPDLPALFGERPICKDFLKGECKWSSCRFRHLSKKQFDLEIGQHITGSHNMSTAQQQQLQQSYQDYVSFEQSQSLMSSSHTARGSLMWTGGSPPDGKRRRMDMDNNGDAALNAHMNMADFDSKTEVVQLRHENALLKQRVEELKKQVQDFVTTNEFLLDQNAQLRMGAKQQQQHQQHQQNTTTVVNAMAPTQISVPIQPPSMTMTATMPPPTITMSATLPQAPTLVMSGATMNPQPTLAMSSAALGGQPTIAMSAGAPLVPQPTIAMSMSPMVACQPSIAMSAAAMNVQPTIAMSGAAMNVQPTIAMSGAAMREQQPTLAMSGAGMGGGQPTIAMSGPGQAPQPQTISITAPVVPTQPPPTISLAVESLTPAGIDAACRAAGSGVSAVPPPSVSMSGHNIASSISCHGQQQPAVHVQETRLVTYPITSIRQQQM